MIREFLFIALVAAVSGLLVLATNIPNHRENAALKSRERRILTEVKTLEREQERLKLEKDALKNDPLFVEYCLRKKLKLKRRGETLFGEGRR